jgi:hypothetical protein
MKINKTKNLIKLCAVAVLCAPLVALAQADSVSAGKLRGGWKDKVIPPFKSDAPGARYLLKGVLLRIDGGNYGVFTNKSPYALHVVLYHWEGSSNRERGYNFSVDGLNIGKSHNIDSTATVVIQPNSTYNWNTRDLYRVTAWVLSDEVGFDVKTVSKAVGLPSEDGFLNPRPLPGLYVGCATVIEDIYDFEWVYTGTGGDSGGQRTEGWKFRGEFPKSTAWYYRYLGMSDGGDPFGIESWEGSNEAVVYVVSGGAPANPGVCRQRHERVEVGAPQTDQSGGT